MNVSWPLREGEILAQGHTAEPQLKCSDGRGGKPIPGIKRRACDIKARTEQRPLLARFSDNHAGPAPAFLLPRQRLLVRSISEVPGLSESIQPCFTESFPYEPRPANKLSLPLSQWHPHGGPWDVSLFVSVMNLLPPFCICSMINVSSFNFL